MYDPAFHNLMRMTLGSDNVYYVAPAGNQMQYPCIVYNLEAVDTRHGNNAPYLYRKRYEVTYISKTVTDAVPEKLLKLPLSSFAGGFRASGLNHTRFNIYY